MSIERVFMLSHEENLQPEHIGRVMQVEHYEKNEYRKGEYSLHVHTGALVSFTESFGAAKFEPDEIGYQGDGRIEFPDISNYDDGIQTVVIHLKGRSPIRVREQDYARILIMKEQSA